MHDKRVNKLFSVMKCNVGELLTVSAYSYLDVEKQLACGTGVICLRFLGAERESTPVPQAKKQSLQHCRFANLVPRVSLLPAP